MNEYIDGNRVALDNGAIFNSDAIIEGSKLETEDVLTLINSLDKPFLAYNEENFVKDTINFYKSLLEE